MPNRPRPVRLIDVFKLDRSGRPVQVHFPSVEHNRRIEIGPAFMTRSAAQAALGHVLEIKVTSPDETWDFIWFERSEAGQPAMYGHTEQKALLRMKLAPGLLIEMFGYHPPCPYELGCMNALEILARKHNVDIFYHVEQEDRSALFEFSAAGRRSGLRRARR